MSAKRCPMCGAAGGWYLSDMRLAGQVMRTKEFTCGTMIETVRDFGITKTVTSESKACLKSQRDRLAKQVADFRALVEDAYWEGADDMARDNANFQRSNAQATLEDIGNQ